MKTLPEPSSSSNPLGPPRDAGSSRAEPTARRQTLARIPASAGVAPLGGLSGVESEALRSPAAAGGFFSPQASKLDTLQSVPQDPGIAGEYGLIQVQVLEGQRALDLEGVPAQVGFDGLGYAIPTEVLDPDDPPQRTAAGDASQLAFAFGTTGVQMGFDQWHRARDARLLWLAAQFPRGKTRKALVSRAKRGSECGRIVRQRVCTSCAAIEAKTHVASNCESRTCPASARADALKLRAKLFTALKRWPSERNRAEWFFHTVTVRRPDWTSIDRLRVDRRRALDGWRAAWKLIRALCGGTRAYLSVEVSHGGMVHAHVLAHHRFITPYQLGKIRKAILDAIGVGQAEQYKVVRIKAAKGGRGGVKEVAKYVTKGVAMNHPNANQTHPLMAAMVEVAFMNLPIAVEYGNWDGLDVPVPDEGWCCKACGGHPFHWRYFDKLTRQIVEVPEARGPP